MTKPPTAREAQWLAEGYTRGGSAGGFIPHIAAIYFKADGEDLTFRVEVGAHHCNQDQIVHGGFIATLADMVLGYNISHRLPKGTRTVTVNLTIDYLRPVTAGACLASTIDRLKVGRTLCHASGAILADDRLCAAMRATFAVVKGATVL